MLINTVILFIKDILPICILCCFIHSCVAPRFFTLKLTITLVLSSLFGIYVISLNLIIISQFFNGGGIEVCQTVIILLVYLGLLITSTYLLTEKPLNQAQYYALFLVLMLYIIMNLGEFLLFMRSDVIIDDLISQSFAGIFLGMGICASFSALLYLALKNIYIKSQYVTIIIWTLYLAGLMSKITNKLQQIDMLNTGDFLWNSSYIINDASEYGYVLNALFGYVSTPTLAYAVIYLVSIIITISFALWLIKRNKQNEYVSSLRSST